MRTLAFDGRTGASGDMLLAALIAAGADPDALAPVEAALPVTYDIDRVTEVGVEATRVVVRHTGEGDTDHDHENGTAHDDHEHEHEHEHDHAEGSGPTRTFGEVIGLLEGMELPERVRADARATFRVLGEAEAAVHGTDLESTAFHEVGADDAIADVVGAALLVADLDPDRVVTTPVAAGGGETSFSHGTYPVPTPAVVNVAAEADWELRGGPVDRELLTPTGAAVLARFAEGVESLPPMRVEHSGYGAGGYDLGDRPNVLRATVGRERGGLAREGVRLLETNLDDASPELLGDLQRSLADAGALDVSVVPLTMKKSRPGHLVKVVVREADAAAVARRLAAETGTLGVREAPVRHRFVADRRYETATLSVDGDRYDLTVKVAADEAGDAFDVSAEHDDAAAVADATGLPTRELARRAEAAVREGGGLDARLFHVVDAPDWEHRVEDGEYRPPSLEAEGFVHLSPADSVATVAEVNYADLEAPLLVVLDRPELDSVRYEETPAGPFPHAYGPLPLEAVVETRPFPREDGRYVLPPELSEEG
jgi:hypothetical protein